MAYGFNAQEVFTMALQIEENGKHFYEEAARKVDDSKLRAVFSSLAQEEIEHKDRFQKLMEELPSSAKEPTVWDPEKELDVYLKMMADSHVFRADEDVSKFISQISTPIDAIKLAMQFEKDTIIFFLAMQDATEEGKGRDRITQLVKEEQQHLRKLTGLLRAFEYKYA